ncbi:16S rRNA (cytidine(1402)-2'-O)-methyltransferase [Persephonella sp.]
MGTLFVVATPIGNLKDISFRAVEVLKNVDLIACEDTRVTKKLLSHYGIVGKKLIPYHEHNELKMSDKIVKILKEGKDVALVSDAGTPCVSDPGYRLVKSVWDNDLSVVPIPGPFAGVTVLSASGLPSDRFLFVGFLSSKKGKKEKEIEELISYGITFIIYETHRRLLDTLNIIKTLNPMSKVVVGKEITKIHEKIIRGEIGEVIKYLEDNPEIIRGEFVIICKPEIKEKINEELIFKRAEELKKEGLRLKEISLKISNETGISKNKIYQILLKK